MVVILEMLILQLPVFFSSLVKPFERHLFFGGGERRALFGRRTSESNLHKYGLTGGELEFQPCPRYTPERFSCAFKQSRFLHSRCAEEPPTPNGSAGPNTPAMKPRCLVTMRRRMFEGLGSRCEATLHNASSASGIAIGWLYHVFPPLMTKRPVCEPCCVPFGSHR